MINILKTHSKIKYCKIKKVFTVKLQGFTLSEVLITIVIIGIISTITIPQIVNNYKWKQYQAATFKAKSMLENASIKYKAEYGYAPECAYWKKNPYGPHSCATRDSNGKCTKYILNNTGEPIPSDYNGPMADCKKFYDYLFKAFKIIKVCQNNAYLNGCIPKYEGMDSLYKQKNPDVSDYELNTKYSSLFFGFQKNILEGPAFVTADGMIFFLGSGRNTTHKIAVDVNGYKGPNKWGHDLRIFMSEISQPGDPLIYYEDVLLEEGGITTSQLLYKE